MKVSLITYTEDALNLLLRTKGTRLSSSDDPHDWSEERKAQHLDYMLTTIKSSWEFVDYVFKIEGVTRAFTHEFVRHRHGSFAQQSQRVVDAREFPIQRPPSIANDEGANEEWDAATHAARYGYAKLVDLGIPIQDARGLLPTAVETSIMAKFNLRSLSEMAKVRLCTRATGEFQDVMRAMRDVVNFVHPWTKDFINVQCVSDGTCAFPRYGKSECPVYFPDLDRESAKQVAATRWETIRYSANPRAKGGMSS